MVLPSTKTVGAQAKNLPLSHLCIYSSNNPCLTEDPWICLLVLTFLSNSTTRRASKPAFLLPFCLSPISSLEATLVAPTVKKLQCRRPGPDPGSGRSLGEGNEETHCSILAWRSSPWTEEPDRLRSRESQVGHDLVAKPPNHYRF